MHGENPWSCHFWSRTAIIQHQRLHLENRESTTPSSQKDSSMISGLPSALGSSSLCAYTKITNAIFFPRVSQCCSWPPAVGEPPPDNSTFHQPVSHAPTGGKGLPTKRLQMRLEGCTDPAARPSLTALKGRVLKSAVLELGIAVSLPCLSLT